MTVDWREELMIIEEKILIDGLLMKNLLTQEE